MLKIEHTEVVGWGGSYPWNAQSDELLGEER